MNRAKRSILWLTPSDEMQKVVYNSKTFTEILGHFNMSNKGNNGITLRKRLDQDNIDYSHIPRGRFANRGISRGGVKKIPLEDILVNGSDYSRYHLKKRLLEAALLKEHCYKCLCLPIWNGMPLTLQLEHKNGISNDNRIENLELLCPNCHSQTSTFAGKNIK